MMTRTASFGLALVLAIVSGCSLQDLSIKPSAASAASVMPDVTGLTPSDARAKLAAAGLAGHVSLVDNYVCHNPAVKVGHVCYTSPLAGRATGGPRLPMTLYVRPPETAMPMPDVVGRTEAEAQRILTASGFKRVQTRFLDAAPNGCQPGRVCTTSPTPGRMAGFDLITVIYVASQNAAPKQP